MSKLFTIRVGDRKPYLAYKFGFSLEDALGVTFSAKDATTELVFINNQPAVIANGTYTIEGEEVTLTPASGIAFYPWAIADTAVERASCLALFHINWPGNVGETLPSDGYERFRIGDNF
ncbi:MAG: hypothetical protein MUE83_11175 [Tabrizicola sp.]|jgi:hypothetical protein|nr:hypothetical protein [Tabrizicola sp.]